MKRWLSLEGRKDCWSQERGQGLMALLRWCRDLLQELWWKRICCLSFQSMRQDDCVERLTEEALERPACQIDLCLTSENLGFERVPTISRNDEKWLTVPKLWKQCGLCWTPDFFLGLWDLYMLGTGCLHDQALGKSLGTKSLVSFPGRQHFTRDSTIHFWRN